MMIPVDHRAIRARGGHSSQVTVIIALCSDLLVAVAKFATAAFTGSSAMLSEAVHSTVDTVTGILLLYGLRVSQRPSTRDHPLGFGREIYFWNFIVSLIILAIGAGVTLLDGIGQLVAPEAPDAPLAIFIVLGIGLMAETVALCGAIREAGPDRPKKGWRHHFRTSRNATSLTVIYTSITGILGLVVAATGTGAAIWLNRPQFDGAASIAIAMILAVTAAALARNNKDLLIGVPAKPETVRSIIAVVGDHALVERANGMISVHLAPEEIMVALSVQFVAKGSTRSIETAIAEIERDIIRVHPEVVGCFIVPQSRARYLEISHSRGW